MESAGATVLERGEEVSPTSSIDHDEKVIIELTGSKARHGMPLANFEQFVEGFRRR